LTEMKRAPEMALLPNGYPNGLEITAERRCIRHPEEVLGRLQETGEMSYICAICTTEQQEQGLHGMADESLRSQSREGDRAGVEGESELGVVLSRVLSGQAAAPGGSSNNNNNGMNGSVRRPADIHPGRANASSSSFESHDDGISVDSMERLIARWCQLQDAATSTLNQDTMLGSTLILLQLQKLERRVKQQEVSLQDLSANMRQQQSAIQSNLTQILSFMAVVASNQDKANAQGQSTNSNNYKEGTTPPSLQVSTSHHSYIPGSAIPTTAAASAVSALSGSEQTVSSHQGSSYFGRYPSASKLHEIVLSPQNNYERTSASNMHPSSVFTSVRTVERQPPPPPKRHDSFQSLGRHATGASTGDLSSTSTSIQQIQPPTVFVPEEPSPNQQEASTPVQKISSTKKDTNITANGAPTATGKTPGGGVTRTRSLPKSKSKSSSFRSSTPQLEIIWDASEHTSGQSPSTELIETRDKHQFGKKNLLRGKAMKPMLATSLDDDEDAEDEDARSLKIFSAIKGYMDSGPPQLEPINNHDSCLTGMLTFMDETDEDNEESNHGNELEGGGTSSAVGTVKVAGTQSIAEALIETTDEDDDDDDAEDDDADVTGSSKNSSQKDKKKEKKEQKKMKKKEKKEQKKMNKKQGIIINNKVSPSTEEKKKKARGRRSRSLTAKIFWNRSSRVERSQTSPVMPERQLSTDTPNVERAFSFVDDNPRSHQGTMIANDTHLTRRMSRTSAYSYVDGDETMTVKTPMTARTPMTAKTPQDAIIRYDSIEPPPPPQGQKGRQYRRDMKGPNNDPSRSASHASSQQPSSQSNSYLTSYQTSNQAQASRDETGDGDQTHSPAPRRRAPFPRTRGMMPTLANSKREILVGGESARMQISTLTLDTALPSADAGSVLQEVNSKSITDKCQERGTYTGTCNEREEPDGFGTMIYNSGAFYKGHWKEGHW
jgi:hypothetical protein